MFIGVGCAGVVFVKVFGRAYADVVAGDLGFFLNPFGYFLGDAFGGYLGFTQRLDVEFDGTGDLEKILE